MFVSSQANSPYGSGRRVVCSYSADMTSAMQMGAKMWTGRARGGGGGGVRRGTTLIMGKIDRGLQGNGSSAVSRGAYGMKVNGSLYSCARH